MRARFVVITCVLMVAGVLGVLRGGIATPAYTPFKQFPSVLGEWRLIGSSSMTEQELEILRLSDYMLRRYARKDGKVVDLYVSFHGGGKETGPIHSPRNCLPGSGWHPEHSVKRSYNLKDGTTVQTMKATYGKDGHSAVFYYWFDVLGNTYTSEIGLKLAEVRGALFHGRRDAMLIRVSVPSDGDADVDDAAVGAFLERFYPVLRKFIPV